MFCFCLIPSVVVLLFLFIQRPGEQEKKGAAGSVGGTGGDR